MENLREAPLTQIAIVVRDIEATAAHFAALLGRPAPPLIITDTQERTQAEYRGRPLQGRAKIMIFPLGPVALELIEPIGGPSTWADHLEAQGESVHHIAFQVKGMSDALAMMERSGMSLMQKGEFTGGRYAYVDSAPKLGVAIELLEIDR